MPRAADSATNHELGEDRAMRGERQTECEQQGGGEGEGLEHGLVYSFDATRTLPLCWSGLCALAAE